MPRTLTDKSIASLRVNKRTNFTDPKLAGHYVRVTPGGSKTFVAVARDVRGKQVWKTIGTPQTHTLEQARDEARAAMRAIRLGTDADGPESFDAVAENWLKRHVDAKGILTSKEKRRYLSKHILPAWGGRDFTTIKRSDVAKLMDRIQDDAGPCAADAALGVIRSICNWYATRNDDYTSPIIAGMKRTSSKERARKRILSDDEIRAVWTHAEANGVFGALVRLLLLTGQRRTKVASMRWEHITLDGTWTVPGEGREKSTGKELVLPELAMEIIKAQPRFASSPYVLSGRYDGTHFSNYGNAKAEFDKKLPAMPQWGLHDLRRTARSLMSRAGVRPDIAERVLGHSIRGIEGIYDRHAYRDEKAHALRALAGLIENILTPADDKVRRLRG
jgi:integrase